MTDEPIPGPLAALHAAAQPALPRWEWWTRWALLAVFVVAGLNHVHSDIMYGQDFGLHAGATDNIIAHPAQWFPQDFTNRPLVYWMGAAASWITHGKATYEVAGIIFVFLNSLALFFLHEALRLIVRSPALRVAALAFIAFLPATEVGALVYAADAVCQLPFAVAAWSLARAVESHHPRGLLGFAVVACVALCVGAFARFTFFNVYGAALVALLLLRRGRRIVWSEALLLATATIVIPGAVDGWIQQRAHRLLADHPVQHTFNWHGTGEMTWSSVLLVKPSDREILAAPCYWDSVTVDGTSHLLLLIPNRFSYPALLHLTTFSDVLDYAHDGNHDDGTPRPEPQKSLAQWSVRLGLVFTLAGFLAVGWFGVRCIRGIWQPDHLPATGELIWGGFALAWYLPLVLVFPYLHNSYEWGYWLSRLIIPALWGFSVVLFATLDRVLDGRPMAARVLSVAVVLQAGLHVASLWY